MTTLYVLLVDDERILTFKIELKFKLRNIERVNDRFWFQVRQHSLLIEPNGIKT